MSKVLVTESYLSQIANAIRSKLGGSTEYRPSDMAAAILSIPTGGITPTGTKNISQNGTHDVTQYASANVNVQPNLQSKTVNQNGTVTPDQGYDGLSSVLVNVSGGGGSQIETASIFRWILKMGSAYTTAWGVLKNLNGDVIGQNIDNAVNTATMDGQLMTVVFHGTSQSVEITAKTSINLSVYQSGRTMGTITPTVYAMGNGDTQTLTSDNLYGGLYIEAVIA